MFVLAVAFCSPELPQWAGLTVAGVTDART